MRSTVTSAELLAGLRDPQNRTVWGEFVERYRPVLCEFGRRVGLPGSDAEDAAQQALLQFAQAFCAGRYDPARGRLRQWLFGIANHAVRDRQRRRAREPHQMPTGDPLGGTLEALPADDALHAMFEEEWRSAVLAHCLEVVRGEIEERSYAAFVAFALEGRAAADVAAELGMTENAVYGTKRRVLARVREVLAAEEDRW